eukprot:TRINITY_DN38273_c0_g1_i1.p1 TRINITY_DN38273_c0_g1~~TRINITY_DN38273_c0_g1_i1.p1  ORF type:complete len:185 (-),score=19.64 TRINITY_DN38273_c0_g1_i1:87-641(-)
MRMRDGCQVRLGHLRRGLLPLCLLAYLRDVEARILEASASGGAGALSPRALMRHDAVAREAGKNEVSSEPNPVGTQCMTANGAANYSGCSGDSAKCEVENPASHHVKETPCADCPNQRTCNATTKYCICINAVPHSCEGPDDCDGPQKWCLKTDGQGKKRCGTCTHGHRCHGSRCQCKVNNPDA